MPVASTEKNVLHILPTMSDYFCTVGFGIENFAVRELKTLSGITINEVLVGKVFCFKSERPVELKSLKTVERLFVKVFHSKVDSDFDCIEDWLCSVLQKCVNWSQSLLSWKYITEWSSEKEPKFRVNTRLSGKYRHPERYRKVSTLVGDVFVGSCNSLTVDLSCADLDVFVHLNDEFLTVGLQVNKKPLSERSYLRHITVRSTVCCAMCMAVNVTEKDIVADPMCGAGTILVEAVKQFNVQFALGLDCSSSQLEYARENLLGSATSDRIDLICADSRKNTVYLGACDVILCDVPFGRKFGKPDTIKALLEDIVKAVDIFLKPGGRVALLVCENLTQFLINTCPWNLLDRQCLRLGTLTAVILSWRK